MAFLRAALAAGPRPAAEVETQARAQGFKHTTIQTARERLKVTSTRRGGHWYWSPPTRRRRT